MAQRFAPVGEVPEEPAGEVELYSEAHQRLWLRRPNPSDAVLVEVPEGQRGANLPGEAARRAAEGYPSTVADFVPAVRMSPPILLSAARGFLRFVRETHEHLGYPGPVRVEVRVSGDGSYLAVLADPEDRKPRFYFVSERTELRASIEVERVDHEWREAELAERLATRIKLGQQ